MKPPRVQWRVYYGDGRRIGADECDPFKLPAWDVQAIACHDPDPDSKGSQALSGVDYYWWENDQWQGGNFVGLVDYLARPGPRKVLVGRMMPWAAHKRIVNEACQDRDVLPGGGAP